MMPTKKYPYLKRFVLEAGSKKQNFLGENPKSRLMLLTGMRFIPVLRWYSVVMTLSASLLCWTRKSLSQ